MDFLGSKYYKLNRRLLLIAGLWPYEHSLFKYCQVVFYNIIVLLTMISQIVKLISLRHNIQFMLTILSPIVLCLLFITKYQTFCIIPEKTKQDHAAKAQIFAARVENVFYHTALKNDRFYSYALLNSDASHEQIRRLMEHVEKDWNMLKDKRELDIIKRYTSIGTMCTLGFTILGSMATIICILMPFVQITLDILAPLNVSRSRHFLSPGEYYFDQQRYFYVILLHLDITLIVVIVTLLSTESLYVTHVQHACGLFQVASYRMNRAFDKNLLQNYTPEKRTIIVCQRIIEAVYMHKRALEFSELLWSSLVVSYSILLIIGITSLTIHLLCLFQAVLIVKEMKEIIRGAIFIFGHIFYLFLGNYVGQILIDHSANIFEETYLTQWCGAPLQAQKLLPIIMQRSTRSCKMVVGGMFTPSLEGFATLMSTTMSYFTVLWSVQK